MKSKYVFGVLLSLVMSACSASVEVAADAAADDESSSVDFPSGLDGKFYMSACDDGGGEPPMMRAYQFDAPYVFEMDYIFLAADCESISASPDLVRASAYYVDSYLVTGDQTDVTVTSAASLLTAMSAAGASVANDTTSIGFSGSICDLTNWVIDDPKVISGITGTAGPCWNTPAVGLTLYNRFEVNGSTLTPYEFELDVNDVGVDQESVCTLVE
jgi:hypothetical protein